MTGWLSAAEPRAECSYVDEALAEELAAIDALPAYLTREEAWTFLRISEATLDRALDRGELARRRIGGRTTIPRASVRAWVMREAGVSLVENATSVEFAGRVGVPKPPIEGSTT